MTTAQTVDRRPVEDTGTEDVKRQLGEVFADIRQSIAERAARADREAS